MSFTDRLVLWLHIGFAIFTVGPLALAISSTPRYIRRRDVPVLRYLSRITLIFTAAALLVLVFGVVLGQLDHDFSHPWLTAAMTLFVVAIVLLVLIMRDQRRAIRAITPANVAPAASAAGDPPEQPEQPDMNDGAESGPGESVPAGTGGAMLAEHVASVERGRIAGLSGVVNLIWLVILVLMVWQP
jgi:hypothetical protein